MTSFTRPQIPSSRELEAVLIMAAAVAVAAGDGCEGEQAALAHAIGNRANRLSGGAGRGIRLDPRQCREAARGLLSDIMACRAGQVPSETSSPAYWRALGLVCQAVSGQDQDPTGGATRCHRHDAAPPWADGLRPQALVGRLFFYDVGLREP